MITITNAPIGHPITGVLRAGDPVPDPQDADLVNVPYPYPLPEGERQTWLSLKADGSISASATVGPDERFQESNKEPDPKKKNTGMLEGERNGPTYNGPLQLGVTYGLK